MKLTPEQVLAMRQRHAHEGTLPADLAREYGVAESTVVQVLRGLTWQKYTRMVDVYLGDQRPDLARERERMARWLRGRGMSQRAIAAELGVSQPAVSKILARIGVA